MLTGQFDRPDLALQIAGEDVGRLQVMAGILESLGQSTESVDKVRHKIVTLLEQRCRVSDPPAWALAWLAGIYSRDGKAAEAIACYRQALALEYGRVAWRYNLARLLAETGAVVEAIHEAETCLRFRPEHARAKRLIKRLSVD
ncbi:MAG: tetratricopeptide repeat protein [Planctomycetota bacterium]